MIPLRPAPLLPFALVFGVGCFAGLRYNTAPYGWLVAGGIAAVIWAVFCWGIRGRHKGWMYAALLAFAFTVGGFHGAIRETFAPPGDLRLLPDEKWNPQTQWRGVVTGDPRFRPFREKEDGGRTTLVLQVTAWRPADNAWQPARGLLQVRADRTAPDQFRYGDTLEITGPLHTPQRPRNPGQFDAAVYLMQRDIYYETPVQAGAINKISSGAGSPVTRWAWQAREWALAKLRLGIEDDPVTSSLLAGMLLGYVEQIPPEIETAFRNTGTYHIFAVSGQNVAVICSVIIVALQMAGFVRWRWGWLTVPVLVFYCLLTGGQPSAVRALLMAILVLAAWWCERPVSVLNLWSLALAAVLAYDPKLVTNLSFQLSFAVVGAIILLTPTFYHFLARPFRPEEDDLVRIEEIFSPWKKMRNKTGRAGALLIASSCAAWLGSLPLMAWYFHQITLIGLLANLVVVPLAAGVVTVGALALAVAPFSTALTAVINNTNWLLVKILVGGVMLFARVPGGCFFVPDPTVAFPPSEPEFLCAQTGASTTLLIRHHSRTWLLNTGTDSQFRYVTNPVHKFYGINRLDGVILGELNSLQAGGATALLSENLTTRWLTPPVRKLPKSLASWKKEIEAGHVSPEIWTRGRYETLAPGFTVEILSPATGTDAMFAEDRGLVLLFRYRNQSLLYAGRISADTEAGLLQAYPNLHADVLVQGPHGSLPNLSSAWLAAIQPRHIILSVPSSFNSRLAPLELIDPRKNSSTIWRQEEAGAVSVKFTRSGIKILPFVVDK